MRVIAPFGPYTTINRWLAPIVRWSETTSRVLPAIAPYWSDTWYVVYPSSAVREREALIAYHALTGEDLYSLVERLYRATMV